MASVSIIKAPIAEEMKNFEKYFKKSLKSKVPLLNIVMNYVIRSKGKQMRPMLVFLSAKLVGNTKDATYTAAALIELLHTATLVHDDVVDEAYERRSFFSINALWKSKIAVLLGDYLLSKGLLLAVEHNEFELLRIVSEAVKEMSEGELWQIEKARKLDINEEIYYEIIRKKTATLIASCTASGASSVDASQEEIASLKKFGEYLGIAFQMKDDLFDYQPKGIVGKPTGNDIKEKKMTLPLIFALKNSSPKEKKQILHTIRKHNKNTKKVQEIINLVKERGGIEYTEQQMNIYKEKALDILNTFPDNDAKAALKELVDYVVSRKK